MNEKVLEHLYNMYINLDFEEIGVEWKRTDKYLEVSKIHDTFEKAFEATLTKKQLFKYRELLDLKTDVETEDNKRVFCDAFKLAHMLSPYKLKETAKEVVA